MVPSPDHAGLPADFWEFSQTWVGAAGELCKSLPNIQDHNLQRQIVDKLGEIIRVIDQAVDCIDLSDVLFPLVRDLLFLQSFALRHRHLLLRDLGDFRRAAHLLEILPQFSDPTDTFFSQCISRGLNALLELSSKCFLNSRRPSQLKFIQLLERFGIPSDFGTRAKSITERADAISGIPAEVHGCSPQSSIIQDIDWIIATIDIATEDCSSNDQDLRQNAKLLSTQMAALKMRFRFLGDTADLDRVVHVSKIVSQSHNPTSRPSGVSHRLLASFPDNEPLDDADIDKNIAIGDELLANSHKYQELTSMTGELKLKVAWLLLVRFDTRHVITDGERVLQLCEDALPFVVGVQRSIGLALRAGALFALSESCHGRQFLELSQSLQVLDEGLVVPFFDKGQELRYKAAFLWHQLRNATVAGEEQTAVSALREIHARGYTHWEPATHIFSAEPKARMPQIVEALKRQCITRSRDTEGFKPFAITLIIALWWQYYLSGDSDTGSLQEALSLRSQLVAPGMYGFDSTLYGQASTAELNGMERRPELAKVLIDSSSRGIPFRLPEMPEWEVDPQKRNAVRADWVKQLGIRLRGDDSSFEVSHRELLLNLSVSKDDPSQRWYALIRLGFLCRDRYHQHNETKLEDLQRAVDWWQQGVDTLGESDQGLDACGIRMLWAIGLFDIYKVTKSVEHPSLLRAHDSFRQVAASARVPANLRLAAVFYWIDNFPKQVKDVTDLRAIEVCDLALSLFKEQSWAASSPRLSVNARNQVEHKGLRSIIPEYALGVIARIIPGGIAKAVELIEASQALVWGQLHRLRVPLGDLETASPPLASRFQQLSRSLERRMGLLSDSDAFQGSVDPPWTNNWQLNQDLNRVIEEIRALSGFENFLQQRSFGEDELRVAAKDGPVVMLINSGMGLILLEDRYELVDDLPITKAALKRLHNSLRWKAKMRNSEDLAEEVLDPDISPSAIPQSSAVEDDRAGAPKERKTSMEEVLKVLWDQVVEPIVRRIINPGAAKTEKLKKEDIPELEDRKRIWWYCLGEFSFLPIHAAGIYKGGSLICLSDFFVSSYTPTITALLAARDRIIPPEIKIFAAAQPNPGGGWGKLEQVRDELEVVAELTPSTNIIFFDGTDQLDTDGIHTSVENALKKLPEASILHLACHGTQNSNDPLSSGFVLGPDGKKLTIEDLMKHRLPNAHTAILSACHTASNDAEQPNEAINLSSALMFLGFSNILATKWPMNDFDGPVIAKAVYKALFGTAQQLQPTTTRNDVTDSQEHTDTMAASSSELEGHPSLVSFSLAKVVDHVVRYLRLDKKVSIQRWATFVHVGI